MTAIDPASPKPSPSEPELRWSARGVAAYLIPVGAAGFWWTYHTIHTRGEYSLKIALLAPALLVLGLFFLLFPDEDPMKAPALRDLSLRQWLSYAFAIGAAIANCYALAHGWYP